MRRIAAASQQSAGQKLGTAVAGCTIQPPVVRSVVVARIGHKPVGVMAVGRPARSDGCSASAADGQVIRTRPDSGGRFGGDGCTRDSMNTKTLTPDAAMLDADEYFALRQLCSTAYLSAGRLSDTACAGLLQAGLVWKDRDGFWSATDRGQQVFRRLEDGRGVGAYAQVPTDA